MAKAPSETTILLVEDNEKNRDLAVELLAGAGYRVRVAATTDEARVLMGQSLPDLILLDIYLPGEEGPAILEDLRFLPGGEAVPVIAFTAYNKSGDMRQFIAGGCDGFIGKPFKADHFLQTVGRFLRDGRAAGKAE